MTVFFVGLAIAVWLIALLGGIALLHWIEYRFNGKGREWAHLERMKALETGQPIPDVEVALVRAMGYIATLVPGASFGAAAGGTLIVLLLANPSSHGHMLFLIWGVSGFASTICVALCLDLLRRRSASKPMGGKPKSPNQGSVENLAALVDEKTSRFIASEKHP
jgi:hypothetical protein